MLQIKLPIKSPGGEGEGDTRSSTLFFYNRTLGECEEFKDLKAR